MKAYLLVGVMALVLAAVVMQSFQISALKGQITGSVVANAGGPLDITGWTPDEQMNYEMHGIIPSRFKGSAASSAAPQMVGGC